MSESRSPSIENIAQIIEGLIFTTGDVLSIKKIQQIFSINKKEIANIIKKLNLGYKRQKRAFRIYNVAGGYQMRTIPEIGPWMLKLKPEKKIKLSAKVLETLAIVAYRQPISKGEIDKLRGVDSSYTISFLLINKLIKIGGRIKIAGNPLVYKTTNEFLKLFDLNKLSDLPRDSELNQLALFSK